MTDIQVVSDTQETFSFENEVGVMMSSFSNKNEPESLKEIPLFNYHITLLLSVCFGWTGLDRFYIGKIGTGILKLVTFGGFGIWWLIDIMSLLLNKQTDVYGRDLFEKDKKEITVLCLLALTGVWHYFYLGLNRLGFIKIGILVLSFIFFFFDVYQVGMLFLFIHIIWTIVDLFLILSGRMNSDIYETPVDNSGVKYQSIALIFAITGGFLALDRFYLGLRTLGLVKLFSFGGFGLWIVVDFILILLNSLKDSKGESMVQG